MLPASCWKISLPEGSGICPSTYTMSSFLLPKTVCRKNILIMADFWWRNKRDTKGIRWKSWNQLTKSKALGGFWFRDIEAFNLALLGKRMWRMLQNLDSLLAKIYKSRYFAKSDPLNARLGSRPSYAWRSIFAEQNLIKQGARRLIGDGKETRVWQDQCIKQKPAKKVQVLLEI